MKKIALCIMAIGLSFTIHPLQINAKPLVGSSSVVVLEPTESQKADALLIRLNEINAMNKSGLNSAEKKNLRVEVRTIRHKLDGLGGGVYISVGALIIIIVLLIILL